MWPNSKKGFLGAGLVKKRGSLPRHWTYISVPLPPGFGPRWEFSTVWSNIWNGGGGGGGAETCHETFI